MSVRLSDLQRRVVDHDEGALLVVAGPGSGKTRVLTERVRMLLKKPGEYFRILALTFTNKAANEMIERLADVEEIRRRAFVGTLHSFCMEILANRGKPVGVEGLPNIFELYEDRKQVLLEAVRSDPRLSRLLHEVGDARNQQKRLGQWLGRISELKNSLVLPNMIDDALERSLYELYDAELRASGALDYDDLLLLTFQLLEERPGIANFYQRQYRYICIDEAQDLNEAQYGLLQSLCSGGFRNVLMVGDPRQAIYVWNGANPKYLDLFESEFGADKIVLAENFRCSRAVVAAAKKLDQSYVVEGQLPIKGSVELFECSDEEDEAQTILETLKSLQHSGHPDVEGEVSLDRCAVLARNRFVFERLEEELQNHRVVYHKKVSTSTQQSESDVAKHLELALRIVANPKDRFHLRLLNSAWGISIESADACLVEEDPVASLERLSDYSRSQHSGAVVSAVKAIEITREGCKLSKGLATLERYATRELSDEARALVLKDLAEWRRHWDMYVRSSAGGQQNLTAFLGHLALGTTQQASDEGLALLTVHSAKGMEFEVVFLMGMTEGTFPDYRATGDSLDEERRNAFVAVTRARRLLYLSFPRTRIMPWGDEKIQKPSRYLEAIMS